MDSMIQQVNFYYASLKPRKESFSAITMLVMIGGAVLVMLAVTLYGYKQIHDLQANLDQLAAQKLNMKNQLERAKVQLKPRAKSHLLIAEQLQMEKDLHAARRLSALLQTELGGQGEPYSAYFSGFAQSTLQGLWLKQVAISQSGRNLSFSGETLKPELVPRLLQKLSGQKVFRGHNFNNVLMSRDEEGKTEKILFELKTRIADKELNDAG